MTFRECYLFIIRTLTLTYKNPQKHKYFNIVCVSICITGFSCTSVSSYLTEYNSYILSLVIIVTYYRLSVFTFRDREYGTSNLDDKDLVFEWEPAIRRWLTKYRRNHYYIKCTPIRKISIY